MEEEIYKTMYALTTEQLYSELNQVISKAKGYPDDSDTERYVPIIPEMAKVNVQVVDGIETFDTLCVMPITSDIQINFVSLLANLTLYETYETSIPTN